MGVSRQEIMFEARSAPLHALDARGFRLVALVLLLGSGLTGLLFAWVGAWPVLIFTGAEGAAVVLLLGLYRRHARHSVEIVTLTGQEWHVRRREGRRVVERRLDPYWARLERREGPGGSARLFLVHRQEAVEVGKFLAAEERDGLELALRAAMRRQREPRFRNPQLD
jgi:uncharacterized membrane protein